MGAIGTRFRSLLPGLGILAVVAISARALGIAIPNISPFIISIGIGAFLANLIGVPEWARPGLSTHKVLLETGIVLLGARLTLGELTATGPTVIILAGAVVLLGIVYMEVVASRIFSIGERTTSLLAAGASVCGVSAILAVAGSIDVDETDITYAVATIMLFDALTLLVFPILGGTLDISGKQFGIWAGLSLFSTGPTAAVGFAISETAGQWATVTKLIRNSMIGVVAIVYAVRYSAAKAETTQIARIWSRFPKFLFGFLVVAVIANTGILSQSAHTSIETTSDWLFTLAFAGLGFDIDLSEVVATGISPVLLVLVHFVTISGVMFGLVLYLF